jgi:hypothetical protein
MERGWSCYVRLEPQVGSPVVGELRILPTPSSPVSYGVITAVFDQQWRDMAQPPDGEPAIEVAGETPDGGLTRRLLRAVPLGRAVDLAREAVASWLEDPAIATVAQAGFSETGAPRRPGRKPRPDSFYAEIAALYVDALRRGSRHAVEDTRQAWEGGRYDKAYIRDQLSVARDRELLTRPPAKGVPGGELTRKARDALPDQYQHGLIRPTTRGRASARKGSK